MSSNPDAVTRLPAPRASEAQITSKLEFFRDVNLWPGTATLDPIGWLANFYPEEKPYALNLLNVFLYYSEPMVNGLFLSAFRQLSATITDAAAGPSDAADRWRSFATEARATYVEGEQPRATDSGHIFVRKARQIARLGETQIDGPAPTLSAWLRHNTTPILLLDDFVGSGNQMRATWEREYSVDDGMTYSFAMASSAGADIRYLPLIATTRGMDRLNAHCPGLSVMPVHLLDQRYSLISGDSILWPPSLKGGAMRFLRRASERAGICQRLGADWCGFHDLALPLAFYHSVPDATLPLYFWEEEGWRPLIRRT